MIEAESTINNWNEIYFLYLSKIGGCVLDVCVRNGKCRARNLPCFLIQRAAKLESCVHKFRPKSPTDTRPL